MALDGDAVATGVDVELLRPVAGVERARGRHDLERRARRVQALRGPVQQRRAALRRELREVLVDPGRVEAGGRVHGDDAAGARLDRDHRAGQALALEPLLGGFLGRPRQARDDVVAGHGLAPQRRADVRDHRREVGVRRRQVRVLGQLEGGAAVADGVVPDRMGEQRAERIAAGVEREPVATLGPVAGEDGLPVGRQDQAALDLQLAVDQAGVVAPVCQRRGRPDLPVGGHRDQERDADGGQPEEGGDLAVHVRLREAARSEIMSSRPRTRKLDTIDEPP